MFKDDCYSEAEGTKSLFSDACVIQSPLALVGSCGRTCLVPGRPMVGGAYNYHVSEPGAKVRI